MAELIDQVTGRIVGYDERTGELLIRAPYSDYPTLLRREYKEVNVTLKDSRPLSDKQRRSCYAMIGEIANWCGEDKETTKEIMKYDFISSELIETMNTFSMSDAAMSVVAAFQRFLARFIVSNDIPCRVSLLSMVDDIDDYVYSCLINKRCCICGKKADLHHVDRIGMGRDRTEVITEGMRVLPLCREHHTETHSMPASEFFRKYHLTDGIEADKTICKLYGYKAKGGKAHAQ